MYSRNMEKLILHLTKAGALRLDFDDEIIAGCVVTHDGAVVHAGLRELVRAQPAPKEIADRAASSAADAAGANAAFAGGAE
jgi:hypothetical protein